MWNNGRQQLFIRRQPGKCETMAWLLELVVRFSQVNSVVSLFLTWFLFPVNSLHTLDTPRVVELIYSLHNFIRQITGKKKINTSKIERQQNGKVTKTIVTICMRYTLNYNTIKCRPTNCPNKYVLQHTERRREIKGKEGTKPIQSETYQKSRPCSCAKEDYESTRMSL